MGYMGPLRPPLKLKPRRRKRQTAIPVEVRQEVLERSQSIANRGHRFLPRRFRVSFVP
jgi:hypothetical protein